MFYLPCERVALAGGIIQIANIIPQELNEVTISINWQALNLQHACCSHKNVILNEFFLPRPDTLIHIQYRIGN